MTPEERKELRDKVARLPREYPFRARPYEAWVRLAEVQALLEDEADGREKPDGG